MQVALHPSTRWLMAIQVFDFSPTSTDRRPSRCGQTTTSKTAFISLKRDDSWSHNPLGYVEQHVGLTVVPLHASRWLTRLVRASTYLAGAGCRFCELALPNWQCVLRVEWKSVSTRLKSRWSRGKIRDVFAFGTRISHDGLNSLTRPFVYSTQQPTLRFLSKG